MRIAAVLEEARGVLGRALRRRLPSKRLSTIRFARWHPLLMLLCLSSPREGSSRGSSSHEYPIHFACQVALEAAQDLTFTLALRSTFRDVLPSTLIPTHPSQGQHV